MTCNSKLANTGRTARRNDTSPGRLRVDLARQCGIRVHDEHGDLRPEVDAAITRNVITRTVTAAIWFGITTGYLALTGSYRVPRKYLAGV